VGHTPRSLVLPGTRAVAPLSPQQLHRIDLNSLRDSFQRPQRQVALAAFQTPHVRTVHPDEVGEGLLAEAALLPVSAERAADSTLKITFHVGDRRCRDATCRSTDLYVASIARRLVTRESPDPAAPASDLQEVTMRKTVGNGGGGG
jgi:hypothetical protein